VKAAQAVAVVRRLRFFEVNRRVRTTCADEAAQAVDFRFLFLLGRGRSRDLQVLFLRFASAKGSAGEAAEAVAVEERPIELFWFFEATAEARAGGDA
jgi:hypothetical protein